MKKKIFIGIGILSAVGVGFYLLKSNSENTNTLPIHPDSFELIKRELAYWKNKGRAQVGTKIPDPFVGFVKWGLDNPSHPRYKYLLELGGGTTNVTHLSQLVFNQAIELGMVDQNRIALI